MRAQNLTEIATDKKTEDDWMQQGSRTYRGLFNSGTKREF